MKTSIWHRLLLWVSLGLLIFLNGYTLIHAVSGWIAASGALLLFLVFLFAWYLLRERSDRFLLRFSFILWGLLIAGQLFFVLAMHNNIRYDGFWVLEQAIEMLETHRISPTISNRYFTQVPNNYGLTILTYWYLSLLNALGVSPDWFMRAVQLLNIGFIDLALLLVFLSLKRIKSRVSAVLFLLVCVLSPFSYLWTPYYYTATTSMTFACAAVYLWLVIRDTASRRNQCLLSFLLGILCITGFKVRATSLIAYIAIFLFWTMTAGKNGLRKAAPALLSFILAAFLSFGGWKLLVTHYVPFDTTDTALPVTHFMMMGSRRDGSFNHDDLLYSISLPTKEAKKEGTIAVIKERLRENGLAGNIRLLLDKQLNGWVDGTDSATFEHSLCTDFNKLHPYIIGSKNGYLTSYAQMFRVLQLLLVCISCLFMLKRGRADGLFLLALNLLGGMTFHLLWETSPTYSIPFTFFAYALLTDAIEQLGESRLCFCRRGAFVLLGSCVGLFCVTVCFCISHRSIPSEDLLQRDFVVNQHMTTSGENGPAMELGQTWTQTFETADSFNTLQLYFDNPEQKGNTSEYRITLSDETGKVWYEDMLRGDHTGYDLAYEFIFEPIVPEKRTTYTISIQPLVQDETHYVLFTSQDTHLIDLYPYGTLSIDGTDTKRDLSFRILNRHLAPSATKKEYGLLTILLLSMELILFFGFLRLFKTAGFIHQKRRTVS